MTSSYRDPNITAALAYQAEQEQRRKAQEQPSFIDVAGRAALGLGVAALAGAGIARGLRRNAVRPISVEDLGAAEKGVRTSARYTTRATATPPPSRPAPPAGVAKQQAAEEFTRLARAERPAGVQQISIQDLGPTFRTPSSAENKATLAFLEDVVLPTEQALTRPRLPAASFSPADYLTQKGYVEAAATGTPYSASEVAQLSRRPLVDAADRLLEDTDLLKRVEAEEAALVNVQPEIRGEQSRQQAQVRRALSAQAEDLISEIRSEPVGSLVATQQARTGFNVDQAINALDVAEDQQTGRMKIQLQRNEDLDMGQVEVLEDIADEQRTWMMEQDEPINRVAAQLPDGLPVDQAEGALSFAQNRMQEIREAQEAKGYRGLGVEREMLQGAEGTRLKQASELYAATGDPNVLSLISEAPSLPITVQPKGQQLVTAQSLKGDAPAELKTSSLYSPFKARVANTNKQEDVDTRMTNRISGLGATRESIPKTIINPAYAALEEETNMAMYGMQQGSASAANIYNRNRQIFREGKAPPREIVNPEYLQLSRQIDEAESVRGEVRDIIQTKKSDIEQFPSIYKVADLQEGVRAFYQQTPEGQILPETLEVRTGRRAVPAGTVEKPASGSSIRGLAGAVEMESYIPEERELASTAAQEMAMGPKIGMDPQRREAMVSSPVRWNSLIHSPAQRTPEGFVYTEEAMRKPTAVLSKSFGTRPFSAPDIARASVNASETIRRLQSSNAPGAQEQLNQYIQSLRTKKI
jgi:hypothetical protein